MIGSFKHKGLQRLFEAGDAKGVSGEHVRKLRQILAALDNAATIEAMSIHSFRLHRLKGERAAYWAVTVRANWRVIFRFANGNADDVELVDYH